MVLRLESSGAQPAMISSSYTSESQARHREQLDSRICRQRLGKHVVRPGLLPRLPPQGPGAVGVPPPAPPPRSLHGRGDPHFQGRWLAGPRGVTEVL